MILYFLFVFLFFAIGALLALVVMKLDEDIAEEIISRDGDYLEMGIAFFGLVITWPILLATVIGAWLLRSLGKWLEKKFS